MLIHNKAILILIVSFVFSIFAKAQNSSQNITNKENILIYKIAAYTIEQDKKVQKAFSEDKSAKIIYTCIPAGIVVIEFKEQMNQQTIIEKKLSALNILSQSKLMPGLTLVDAESECSSHRTID